MPCAIDPSRDLLFGFLALQIGLIDQGQLVAAFQAWTRDKGRPMADHLVSRGDLDADDRVAVEALVARRQKRHGGDPEQSLAALNVRRSTRESLGRIGDADVEASLAQLGAVCNPDGEDPELTASYSVGTATSDGERFRVLRPHACGGLGAVFVALDTELHREVALKQISDRHADDPASRQRFLLEAEVTGGLEHPGIVPVYGLGIHHDGRPFYAMRFIKGDSLKQAIERFHQAGPLPRPHPDPHPDIVSDLSHGERVREGGRTSKSEARRSASGGPGDGTSRVLELRQLLRRFTDVCNAIGYAHSRGVLHRDIKPGNVIIGRHGETMVVDWGLAKATGKPDPSSGEGTLLPFSASGSAETLPGSALGTVAYMSPEQAEGDLERLGPRSDVYSLGATLYCLLTGKPPHAGVDRGAIVAKVQRGEFTPPRQVDATIDPALEAICLMAMALRCEDRYASCRALAEGIERWMADEPVSAWREPLSRRARRWARQHRPAVTGAAAALLVALVGLATAATVYVEQRQAQVNRLDLALREVNLLRGQAQADPEGDPVKWHAALEAVKRALDLLGPLIDDGLQRRVRALGQQVASAAQAVDRDAVLLRELVDIRSAEADDPDGSASDAAYAGAFRDAGIEIDTLEPEAAAATVRARPKGVALAVATALDDWAAQRRKARRKDADGWKRLVATARAADPEPTRDRLRQLWSEADTKAQRQPLLQLAAQDDPHVWPPASLTLLAGGLGEAGERDVAADLLRRAQAVHPGDVWVNYDLGRELEQLNPPQRDEAIRFYSVARALRPETAHELAHALEGRGRGGEAVAVLRDLTERRPGMGRHWLCLGRLLKERADRAGAEKALGKAVEAVHDTIRLKPGFAGDQSNLGVALAEQGKLSEAIAEYRAAIRLVRDLATAHSNLANALLNAGKLDEGIAEYRAAIRLQPGYAEAHNNLGNALRNLGKLDEAIAECREASRLKPDLAAAHNNLGSALLNQGKLDEAIAAYREAVRLKPDLAVAHNNLGTALLNRGKLDQAIAAYREAPRLQPDNAGARVNVGDALRASGMLDEAIAECRGAIRLKPDRAAAHLILGLVLSDQGKLAEAIAAYHEAIRLQPDFAAAHCNLASALRRQGNFRESLAELRRGHELGSNRRGWPYPSAQWLRQAERMLALERRLTAVLRGDDNPMDAAERIEFAETAYNTQQFGPSARLYAESFRADPKLAAEVRTSHRYNAACAAAQAGAGKREGTTPLDEKDIARGHKQALDWLRADLAYWTRQTETGQPEAKALVGQKLKRWKADSGLAGIRDETALEALPEDERKSFRALWAEVDELLAKALPGTASRPRR
jgi:serine/threonine protein kinase/tetratricopeptide (TPR) repeat protein